MTFWIARDKYGALNLYYSKPTRNTGMEEDDKGAHSWGVFEGNRLGNLDSKEYPEVTWENSPKQVELKLIEG